MEYADYHVVYVDNRVSQDLDGKLLQNSAPNQSNIRQVETWEEQNPDLVTTIGGEMAEVRSNLRSLLSVFNGGTSSGSLGSQYTSHYSNRNVATLLEADKLQCILVLRAIPAWRR